MEKARWSDIDFEACSLTFHRTKNGDVRAIPLSPQAVEVLRRRFAQRRIGPENWVFPAPLSDNHADFTHRFIKVVRRAAIEDFRFHDLRHTAASELASAGMTERMIGEILGHRTAQMVRRYSHLRPTDLQGAASLLGENLDRNQSKVSIQSTSTIFQEGS